MIINMYAGSGGERAAVYFRDAKAGTLVGTDLGGWWEFMTIPT